MRKKIEVSDKITFLDDSRFYLFSFYNFLNMIFLFFLNFII